MQKNAPLIKGAQNGKRKIKNSAPLSEANRKASRKPKKVPHYQKSRKDQSLIEKNPAPYRFGLERQAEKPKKTFPHFSLPFSHKCEYNGGMSDLIIRRFANAQAFSHLRMCDGQFGYAMSGLKRISDVRNPNSTF